MSRSSSTGTATSANTSSSGNASSMAGNVVGTGPVNTSSSSGASSAAVSELEAFANQPVVIDNVRLTLLLYSTLVCASLLDASLLCTPITLLGLT